MSDGIVEKIKQILGKIMKSIKQLITLSEVEKDEERRYEEHRREIEKLRIEKGQVFRWNEFFTAFFKYLGAGLAVSMFIIGLFAIVVLNNIASVSQSFIVTKNSFGAGGNLDVDIEGDFQGYFTTEVQKIAQKADPRCIDEYEYESLTYITEKSEIPMHARVKLQKLQDKGMVEYYKEYTKIEDTSPQLAEKFYNETLVELFYKLPKNNCERTIIEKVSPRLFIPTKVHIERIKISGNMSGSGESNLLPFMREFLSELKSRYSIRPLVLGNKEEVIIERE